MTGKPSEERPGRYDPAAIEGKWQRYWESQHVFRAPNPGDAGARGAKPKFYILDMFPYPSGAGLHVGHPLGYCATDIVARYKRMRGFNVLHPMGFDSFGLPAEQYAIKNNVHPAVTTRENIDRYRAQLKMFGFSYDWDRELATSDPGYYKFTQWMFLRMFESWYDDECQWVGPDGRTNVGRARPVAELLGELEADRWSVDAQLDVARAAPGDGRRSWSALSAAERRQALDRRRLAYLDEIAVNWCPALGTVLANEEVDSNGRSEIGNHPVFRRPLRQWMLRITRYAERLLNDLADLDWPEPIKLMQRNWVGKSTGAEVAFPLAAHWRIENGRWKRRNGDGPTGPPDYRSFADAIRIYTTRPDTLFGATYMVLAPEHPLVETITTPEHRAAVDQYAAAARKRSDLDRTADTREKTGVFTGAYALNPVSGERIPIWIADYVLMGYGTGAIMAVPGSDTRDFEFACKFDLPIVAVVRPVAAWIEERLAALAGQIDQATVTMFRDAAAEFPELAEAIAERQRRSSGLGEKTVAVLREGRDVERLIAHYVRHPRNWGAAFIDEGGAVNSPAPGPAPAVPGGVCDLNGLATYEAKAKIIAWLEHTGVGRGAINYKLRDWIFSRQKYWGEPFPVLHGEDGETLGLSDEELPVELPPMKDFKPTAAAEDADTLPEPPLARAKEWVQVQRDGRCFRRDVNTMPQWAGSCWYYLRFIDPGNAQRFSDAAAERYWMPVDLYVGGAEHAVLHLLYARFWHKVLYDLGYVSTREPFRRLFNQGMIQGFAYRDGRGLTVGPDLVDECGEDRYVLKDTGAPVTRIIAKMSKSLKNVVNPDGIIAEFGADTFRLYEMYMGPLDAAKPWNTRDVPGLYKLCQRVWRLVVDETTGGMAPALTDDPPSVEALRALHKTIKRVTLDIEQLKFNTAIAAIFDFVNAMTPLAARPRAVIEPFVLVFSPFAPHLAEELWQRLGHATTLAYEPWPAYDEKLAQDEEVEIAVQIAGKTRARLTVPADADESAIERAALADERVTAAIAGKQVRKVIVVKGRLVNIVAT
ncbi:MAG: leucine--tRNA ligase [Planctomycetes bacterium]|nr:leucine--tRNA ligase [Planctomycetota bacterium]